MKIILTVKVEDKLKALTLLDDVVSGFIRGDRIGKFLIVTDFLPAKLNKNNIDSQFEKILKQWGIFLQGFFFKKAYFFNSNILSEKVVLILENNCREAYYMEINGDKPELVDKELLCIEE